MKQLAMLRDSTPVGKIIFPEGYRMRSYQPGTTDGVQWCECCIGGKLGIDEATDEVFANTMLADSTVNPSNIFFLVAPDGEIAGTVTYQYSHTPNRGTIHMVGIQKKYQGLGLALPMTLYAVSRILESGKTEIDLKTDDWRLPAIKVYLNAGFKPVYNDDGIQARWAKVMEQLI